MLAQRMLHSKKKKIFTFHTVCLPGYPPSFQSGLSSALPSYGTSQQSSLYGGDAVSSGGFTIPTTTVSSHSSSSAFHKPDEGTNSTYSNLSGSSGLSSHSSHSSLSSHGAPPSLSSNSNQDSSSGYSSTSSTPQQQVITTKTSFLLAFQVVC